MVARRTKAGATRSPFMRAPTRWGSMSCAGCMHGKIRPTICFLDINMQMRCGDSFIYCSGIYLSFTVITVLLINMKSVMLNLIQHLKLSFLRRQESLDPETLPTGRQVNLG